MDQGVLDDFDNQDDLNYKPFRRIALLSIGTVLFYSFLQSLDPYLPDYLYKNERVSINTIGTIVVILVIINSIYIPTILNKVKPELSMLRVVAITIITHFIIESAFKLIYQLFIAKLPIGISTLVYLKVVAIISLFGGAIALIRIRRLRKKTIWLYLAIVLCIWILIGQLIQNMQ